MNEKTFNIRKAQLLRDVDKHPHRDELLNIMQQQLTEDSVTVDTCLLYTSPSPRD